MPHRGSKDNYVDALRLSEREQADIIARLEAKNANFHGDNRRIGTRFRYHMSQGLIVEITHPGGTITSYLVRPRDLSTRGISFLHGAFVYPNSPCRLFLETMDGTAATIIGRVMRCQHVSGRAHDVGIQFIKQIRLEDYVVVDTSCGPSTSTELPALQGQALYIEDSIVDRELLRFHLRHQGLALTVCSSLQEGVDHLKKKQFDVLLVDGDLPELTPAKIIEAVRLAGHSKPIIVVTGDDTTEAMKGTDKLPQVTVLVKPYPLDSLMNTLAQALSGVPVTAPLLSAFWANQEMRPLIMTFVDDMRTKLAEIEAQAKAGAFAVVQRMSLELKGAAGGYGFVPIQTAASELHALSKSQGQAEAISEQITSLIRLAEAARAGLTTGDPAA